MRKLISFVLVLAMAVSMAACGCNHSWAEATCTTPKTCTKCGETEGAPVGHTPGELVISAVDTEKLTMTQELPCARCGEVLETKDSATGIAPADSVIHVSPNEWNNCLLTNIHAYGAGQSIYGYPVESQDDTLLFGLVSVSHLKTVFSFLDVEGNPITTDQADVRGSIHNIRMDAQFTNDNAKEFYMLLMILTLNNNSSLSPEDANTLAGLIMSGNAVTDNGYTYAMEIVSVEEHRVCISITAE